MLASSKVLVRGGGIRVSRFQTTSLLRSMSTRWQPPKPLLFINNEFVQAEMDARITVVSPKDGKPFAEIANASNSDVDKAVASARACFNQYFTGDDGWPNWSPDKRAQVLQNMSKEITRRLDEFAFIESMDSGKPIKESRGDIETAAQFFEYYATLISEPRTLNPTELAESEAGVNSVIHKEPLGVIGAVTPWNYPLMQAVVKVAPGLAAGCSLVLKPSPVASLSCLMLGEVARDSGLPPGALNVLTGGPPGSDTGIYLGNHPDLDKMSFTGSSGAGSKLLGAAAPLLRPTGLELGGKGAMVVMADANIDTLIDWAMIGCFFCAGQVCSATSRLIVDESIVDELIAKLVSATQSKIVMGDSMSESTTMGPLISADQRDKVNGFIARAISDTDRCQPLIDPGIWRDFNEDGYFVRPQIFRVKPDSNKEWPEVWKEEVFGPVLCISTYKAGDLQEAIQLANDSPYGLGHAVMGSDMQAVGKVSRKLRAGVVWENCSQPLYTTQTLPLAAASSLDSDASMGKWDWTSFFIIKL